MVIFQRNSSQVHEKDTPGFQEIHIHLKGTEKGFTTISFQNKCSKEMEARSLSAGVGWNKW